MLLDQVVLGLSYFRNMHTQASVYSFRKTSSNYDGRATRAGFTLSGAVFGKNVGALHLEKNWRPFLFITVRVPAVSSPEKLATFLLITLVVHSGVAHYFVISGVQKIRHSFCCAPFLWEPLFGRTCWTCLNPPLRETYISGLLDLRGTVCALSSNLHWNDCCCSPCRESASVNLFLKNLTESGNNILIK